MRRSRAAAGSAAFFAAAPGVIAGVVPYLLTRWDANAWWPPVRVVGAVVLTVCTTVLVAAFVRFVAEGRGTPAPVAPTEQLVVGGLYRHVRNPMYVAVVGAILGQALLLGRTVLLAYGAVVWIVFVAFVRLYEEPTLRRRFGAEYDAYRAAVPAWLPRARGRRS